MKPRTGSDVALSPLHRQSARGTFVLGLNGDGKLEVLVHGRYYEGNWTDVYEMRGGGANKVLSAGCGN